MKAAPFLPSAILVIACSLNLKAQTCVPVASVSITVDAAEYGILDVSEGYRRFYDVVLKDANGHSIDGSGSPPLGPACAGVTANISVLKGTGSAGFLQPDGTVKPTVSLVLTQTLPVIGVTRSSTARNMSLAINGIPSPPPPTAFSVVAVELNLTYGASQTLSSDDESVKPGPAQLYQLETSTNKVGAVYRGTATQYGFTPGCGIGVQAAAKVYPADYAGGVTLLRAVIDGGNVNAGVYSTVAAHSDLSLPEWQTNLASPGGFVYDLDIPGPHPAPVGSVWRQRRNFGIQAVFGYSQAVQNIADSGDANIQRYAGEAQIGQSVTFYTRSSCTLLMNGKYQFLNDVPGDNVAGSGCGPISSNLTGSC